jgi:transcriptional regulator with XRE-family HTH domain
MRKWFKDLRKQLGMTQQEMADYVGFSYQLISKIENGGDIKVITAKQIADRLDVDWSKFYEED